MRRTPQGPCWLIRLRLWNGSSGVACLQRQSNFWFLGNHWKAARQTVDRGLRRRRLRPGEPSHPSLCSAACLRAGYVFSQLAARENMPRAESWIHGAHTAAGFHGVLAKQVSRALAAGKWLAAILQHAAPSFHPTADRHISTGRESGRQTSKLPAATHGDGCNLAASLLQWRVLATIAVFPRSPPGALQKSVFRGRRHIFSIIMGLLHGV